MKNLFIAVLIVLMLAGCSPDRRKLYVYTWADYIDPDLIQKFEAENDCQVVIDTFDCNESMYAKLMAGGTGYDVIMPTEYVMPLLISADLIDKLDAFKLPNASVNFDETFKSELSLVWDVPYAFSCTGIMWRKDKVPPDLTFEDWNDMFDSRLNGRICIMNDIREVLGLALKVNGKSVNSVDQTELDSAVAVAKRWKNACLKMDNEAYRTGIPSGEFYAAMSYNSDAIQLMAEDGGKTIGYSVPTNGTTSSIDAMCVMKNSKSKDLAYKFMDMFYDIPNAVKNAEYNGVPMPVKGLYDELSNEYKAIPFMKVTNELKSKCENILDVGDKFEMYSKAWDKVKSER